MKSAGCVCVCVCVSTEDRGSCCFIDSAQRENLPLGLPCVFAGESRD